MHVSLFGQACRLAIAFGNMDCDELIDGLLSAQGTGDGTQQTCSRKKAMQDQEDTDYVQKYRESLPSVAAEGQTGRYGLLAHGTALARQPYRGV